MNPAQIYRASGAIWPTLFGLWFGREAGGDQGFVTAKHSINLTITIFQHDERRTGARVFGWSGAVVDVPGVFVKRVNPGFDFNKGHTDTSHGMAGLILGC